MTLEIENVTEEVRSIRLNRPERLNAINYTMVCDLHLALDEVAADDSCKVVIVSGAGRAFCAGLDLAEWGTPPDVGAHPHMRAGTSGQAFLANLVQHIRATPQVMIAAVNGPAAGGGFALALACDLRIAGASATMCSAFIKTGLTGTDVGISYLLPRLIGASSAFDLILTGRTIDAAESDRAGLVSRVVDDERLWAESVEMAESVAKYTHFGLRNTKEVMWLNLDVDSMAAAIALENRNQELAAANEEVKAYMREYAARHRHKGGASHG